ncbi:hypothetical protein MHU86_16694 [Fragilaria crotonensis]|nr:hypothetical protein MHU86_16694 [Fragilaria crotonensis]
MSSTDKHAPDHNCSSAAAQSDSAAIHFLQNNKSNKNLTAAEKEAKRDRKKELKRKRHQASLDRRLRHAIVVRKDPIAAQKTREELASLLSLSSSAVENHGDEDFQICPNEKEAREFVIDVYFRMKQSQTLPAGGSGCSKETRHAQTNEAVTLLRHMTKGTQRKGMFDNTDALWGYARQKFHERAMLVYASFANLNPCQQPTTGLPEEEYTRRKISWELLTSIRTVCSVGCGPGCDAVGVLAFLKVFSRDSHLNSMVLMDWAMDKWKVLVNFLEPLLVPTLVDSIECMSGDITKPLNDDVNSPLQAHTSQMDLYVFSYILTETRGKWEQFVKDLISSAKPNALFYFAEPTPWQLHHLRNHVLLQTRPLDSATATAANNSTPLLDYIWVDSSMNQSAELQAMDGRLGPGTLLARKL